MRTGFPIAAATWLAAPRLAHKVEIQDADGDWIDLSTWWKAFSWGESQDDGAAGGQLTFRRDALASGVFTSLSPLHESSPLNQTTGDFAPLVNPFRRFRFASAPVGTTITTAHVWAQGVIDDPEFGGRDKSEIRVPVRDLSAPMQDTVIEVERVYGSDAGTAIEEVQQEILDDNGFDTETVAVLGDPDGWSLKPYQQARGVSVWAAEQALAIQMGWDWRYWYHTDDTYAPTLREPRRDTDTVDLTLTAAQFLDLPTLKLNGTDVRNAGELPWRNKATGEAGVARQEDAASIAAFRRRAFGLEEQPNIDTAAEAQQMIDAAVADMATPYLDGSAVLPFLPLLQLGDVLQFPVTTLATDALVCGVTGYRHEVTPERARTLPTLRGRPVGAFTRWLDLIRQRLADRAGTPSPTIGPMLGEASADGGASGDGACWLFVTFEANTDLVEIYNSTGPASPLAAPALDANNLAKILRRQEGTTASAPDWATVCFFATTPDYYKRSWARALGPTGREGLPQSVTAQAVDGFTASLGAITTFTVTRDGTSNTLTWAAATSTSPYDLSLLVWRNGDVVAVLEWATSGTWTDAELLIDRDYVYELQVFTHDGEQYAQSGPRTSYRRAPETPVATAPAFVGIYPVTYRKGLVGTRTVVQASCTDVDCHLLNVERHDGTQWVNVAVAFQAGTPGATVTIQFEDYPISTYRLVSVDDAGVVLAYSAPKQSRFLADPNTTGGSGPGSPL